MRVMVGAHDLSLDSEPHRIVFEVSNAVLNPDWNMANDIALIKLPSKIKFNG